MSTNNEIYLVHVLQYTTKGKYITYIDNSISTKKYNYVYKQTID